MTNERRCELKSLEGRQVSLCLRGGSRIDDCQFVSAGAPGVGSLWLFVGGNDTFVGVEDVLDVFEVAA